MTVRSSVSLPRQRVKNRQAHFEFREAVRKHRAAVSTRCCGDAHRRTRVHKSARAVSLIDLKYCGQVHGTECQSCRALWLFNILLQHNEAFHLNINLKIERIILHATIVSYSRSRNADLINQLCALQLLSRVFQTGFGDGTCRAQMLCTATYTTQLH